jgi:hypothetical protein
MPHAPPPDLVAFARAVRTLGDEPVPRPSPELAALLEGRAKPNLATYEAAGVLGRTGPDDRSDRNHHTLDGHKLASITSKVAGLGLAAKIGLGASVAAACIGGAGAGGMLPAGANHTVRGAIEAVTPVNFHDHDNDHDGQGTDGSNGEPVSSDATGGSDGQQGVDGQNTGHDAPGATQPPGSAAADEPPGQSGDTGLTRANQTPAAAHTPDTPPSTTPTTGGPADPSGNDPGKGKTDHTVPSTVPPAAHGAN